MISAPRATYAQSSDIRARSWPEYRLDMKKKAVAELEFLPFLQQVLAARYQDHTLRVAKSGGDAELWFDAKSVSQAPDYRAEWGNNQSFLYEFQLAEQGNCIYLWPVSENRHTFGLLGHWCTGQL